MAHEKSDTIPEYYEKEKICICGRSVRLFRYGDEKWQWMNHNTPLGPYCQKSRSVVEGLDD